ncbi:hypothetical protein [Candidatus Cyanaurora vandensis]|uniref:hypothetical protein n=1 Tax=Candidatus Cyanaurora vandensis TaxID=2714958 RepID=UPI00257EF724|nr:hypothetical protein [Candidatus Cyanaurora vandensis]
MCTQFVELEMARKPLAELVPAIEAELATRGESLRWAITQVEADRITVEAAVLVTTT